MLGGAGRGGQLKWRLEQVWERRLGEGDQGLMMCMRGWRDGEMEKDSQREGKVGCDRW